MTVRTVAAIISLGSALAFLGCQGFYQVPVEIPIQSKINISSFQRVLIAGFLTGGSKSIDPNTETARLLRSQLRSKQDLRVIDADVLPLMDDATRLTAAGGATAAGVAPPSAVATSPAATASGTTPSAPASAVTTTTASSSPTDAATSQAERDLARVQKIFANADYWKQVGDQYQGPLIVTGSIVFTDLQKSGVVTRPQSYVDSSGAEQYRSVREFTDQKGYEITPTFVFIDGHTGAELYSETFHEEALYPTNQNTPALSSYFELMDKILPNFLNTLSSQKIKGTRVLLK